MAYIDYHCMVVGYAFPEGLAFCRSSPLHHLNSTSQNHKACTIRSLSNPCTSSDLPTTASTYKRRNSSWRLAKEGGNLHTIDEGDEAACEEFDEVDRSASIVRFFKSCFIQFAFIIQI
ncbi:hypothetical protein KP509_08G037500 [Ceratopteris richardii]|uniref:Uncharacterized protein n=1 Tax=Ceratopteris richardii TaxID=49495 RepID=A0A8T2UBP1_CERRI|nr:hypothetical protein KP509_08G037500 [Ceratopteris richardii]